MRIGLRGDHDGLPEGLTKLPSALESQKVYKCSRMFKNVMKFTEDSSMF